MPRPRTVYRGKRKYSWIITLVVFVLVLLILVAVWLFSYLQRYLVYDKDGLQLVMPADRTAQSDSGDDNGSAVVSVPKVDVEIIVDPADYSDAQTDAGKGLTPLHGLYIAAEDLTESNLEFYAQGIGDFNAVVMDLMGADGFLHYHSTVPLTDSYGVNGTLELTAAMEKLKAQDIYLVAQISTLSDAAMATRNAPIALKNAITGEPFQNSAGAWLDPYDDTVRGYLSDLIAELAALGFDEVILTGLYCPSSDNLQFSKTMTLTPDTCSAVSALAFFLRETAETCGITLSAAVESKPLNESTSEAVGQDLVAFFKAFDRVVFDMTDVDAQRCADALKAALGDSTADLRIVPMAEDFAPVSGSYIVK